MGIHILETVEFAICVGFSRKLRIDLESLQWLYTTETPIEQFANGLGWPRRVLNGCPFVQRTLISMPNRPTVPKERPKGHRDTKSPQPHNSPLKHSLPIHFLAAQPAWLGRAIDLGLQCLHVHPHTHTHGGGDGEFSQINTLAGRGLGLGQGVHQCGQIALQFIRLE